MLLKLRLFSTILLLFLSLGSLSSAPMLELLDSNPTDSLDVTWHGVRWQKIPDVYGVDQFYLAAEDNVYRFKIDEYGNRSLENVATLPDGRVEDFAWAEKTNADGSQSFLLVGARRSASDDLNLYEFSQDGTGSVSLTKVAGRSGLAQAVTVDTIVTQDSYGNEEILVAVGQNQGSPILSLYKIVQDEYQNYSFELIENTLGTGFPQSVWDAKWQVIPDAYGVDQIYLGVASTTAGAGVARVFRLERDGSGEATLNQVATFSQGVSFQFAAAEWVNVDGTYFLAIGRLNTPTVRLLRFVDTGSSFSLVSDATFGTARGYGLSSVNISGTTYLVVGRQSGMLLFQVGLTESGTGTLTLVQTLSNLFRTDGLDWIQIPGASTIDNATFFLATLSVNGTSPFSGEVRLYSFGDVLQLTKDVDLCEPKPNDTIVFQVRIDNGDGHPTADNLIVQDMLPSELTILSSFTTHGTFDPSYGGGIWNVGTVASGESAVLHIEAMVNSNIEPGTNITNTATIISGGPIDCNADVCTSSVTLMVQPECSTANVCIEDRLPAGLEFCDAYFSMGQYDPYSGKWVVGDLDSGSTATLTIQARALDGFGGQVVTNTAFLVDPYNSDAYQENNSSSVDVLIRSPYDDAQVDPYAVDPYAADPYDGVQVDPYAVDPYADVQVDPYADAYQAPDGPPANVYGCGNNQNDINNTDINLNSDVTLTTPMTITSGNGGTLSINILSDLTVRGDGHLHFNVFGGSSVVINVLNDLRLEGESDNRDLFITVCCASDSDRFSVVLGDGNTLTLSGDSGPANIGGVTFGLVMQAANSTSPCVTIERAVGMSDAELIVGERSMVTYLAREPLSEQAATFGTIEYNVSNNNNIGLMVLRIEQDGSWVTGGHLFSGDCCADAFTLDDVDFYTEAGAPNGATLRVINQGPNGTNRFVIINENNIVSPVIADPFGDNAFALGDGIRRGFVLAANGMLELNDETYIDYIGLGLDGCEQPCGLCDLLPQTRDRNGSAFIVDGTALTDAYGQSLCAQINLLGSSAIYFRSGADKNGDFVEPSFLIDPRDQTPGKGHMVLDVEGCLEVRGDSPITNALHILSTEVLPDGGPVTIDGSQTMFPLKTFGTNADGSLKQYNSGYFFINNQLDLHTVSLVHSDVNHQVNAKDDVTSEPAYVGGETFVIENSDIRPCINLYNSLLRIHNDIASTGVDWCVPNDPQDGNQSAVIFYHNGFCKDAGAGRNWILGTHTGAFACNNVTFIDHDSHLNVMQRTGQQAPTDHQLALRTAPNDQTMCEGINGDITAQPSMHCIYLGNSSNISIGTQSSTGTDDEGNEFALTTMPTVSIEGNFIAFETRGGPENQPCASATTGRGALFVDNNGRLELSCPIRTYFATMVIYSGSGVLDLPSSQVHFDNRVGIAQWRTDLGSPKERVIVTQEQKTPEYVLDWKGVSIDCDQFVPYPVTACTPCSTPAVVAENITAIPCIEGTVDQLQVKHSSAGIRSHLKINGGFVRELIYLDGTTCADMAGGVVVLENSGCVGLGNGNTTQDSREGIVKLGSNGVTLIANGPGFVQLNNNLTIDGLCHVLTGPDFAAGDKLVFRSDVPREIRVRSCGVLDLSAFSADQIVELDGFVRLVFEPGSKLILGGGILNAEGRSSIIFRQVKDQSPQTGVDLSSTDELRVRLMGVGTINLEEDATMVVQRGAFVGVETFNECLADTDYTINIRNRASWNIGDDASFGGAFQVGNTIPSTYGNTVSFKLLVEGVDAQFEVNSEGFFGLGVGIVDKKQGQAPNSWLIDSLSDVATIEFDLREGFFKHQRILPGSDQRASLVALGPAAEYTFAIVNFFASQVGTMRFLGGGNIINVPAGLGVTAPVVGSLDGLQGAGYTAGLISSGPMLNDDSKNFPVVLPLTGVSSTTLFNFWKVDSAPGVTVAGVQQTPQATIARNTLGNATIGYVFGTEIRRSGDFEILGNGGDVIDDQRSRVVGAVGIAINDLGVITSIQNFNV